MWGGGKAGDNFKGLPITITMHGQLLMRDLQRMTVIKFIKLGRRLEKDIILKIKEALEKGVRIMDNNSRESKIENLKHLNRQRLIQQKYSKMNFPPYEFVASHPEELGTNLWTRINKGEVLRTMTSLDFKIIISDINQLFQNDSSVCTVIWTETEDIYMKMKTLDLINYTMKIVEESSKDALLCWFVFSEDLTKVLLLDETEYEEFQLTTFEEGQEKGIFSPR
ncbi:hypothetical protein [Bacillus sp. Hm123]|uniref:hypothetical protein n=1 Tax=Bacillus sp. Hm123 TaxID=3450745 RepID=UPI003F420FEE